MIDQVYLAIIKIFKHQNVTTPQGSFKNPGGSLQCASKLFSDSLSSLEQFHVAYCMYDKLKTQVIGCLRRKGLSSHGLDYANVESLIMEPENSSKRFLVMRHMQ